MSQFVIALIRTVVPTLVGAGFAWLASVGFALDAETQSVLIVGLVALFTGLYYAGVSAAAKRWPWFQWLLGVGVTPQYAAPDDGGASGEIPISDIQGRHEL